tara:strand:- start:431 stop:577 length:147 start_codon:yes stop_codon:yes gene_type:complete
MKTYNFSINKDKRLTLQAESEEAAWEWLAQTKSLTVEQVKTLYIIKTK